MNKNLNEIAKIYKNFKAKIEEMEKELQPYKMQLEEAALSSPDLKLELDDFKINLVEATRENFNLKEAKAKLGEDALKDFIKVSQFTQLRVTSK